MSKNTHTHRAEVQVPSYSRDAERKTHTHTHTHLINHECTEHLAFKHNESRNAEVTTALSPIIITIKSIITCTPLTIHTTHIPLRYKVVGRGDVSTMIVLYMFNRKSLVKNVIYTISPSIVCVCITQVLTLRQSSLKWIYGVKSSHHNTRDDFQKEHQLESITKILLYVLNLSPSLTQVWVAPCSESLRHTDREMEKQERERL